jgi:hypothetical protein
MRYLISGVSAITILGVGNSLNEQEKNLKFRVCQWTFLIINIYIRQNSRVK